MSSELLQYCATISAPALRDVARLSGWTTDELVRTIDARRKMRRQMYMKMCSEHGRHKTWPVDVQAVYLPHEPTTLKVIPFRLMDIPQPEELPAPTYKNSRLWRSMLSARACREAYWQSIRERVEPRRSEPRCSELCQFAFAGTCVVSEDLNLSQKSMWDKCFNECMAACDRIIANMSGSA